MPVSVFTAATVREVGVREILVARTEFADVMGEIRTMDFTAELALELIGQLVPFLRQVGPAADSRWPL